jgi:heat shock protein HtpX
VARTRFAPDRQLTSRMVFVMFLLGAVYVAAIGVAVALAPKGLLPILIIVIAGFFFAQWYLSDKIALFSMNAKVVQPDESDYARRLHGVLDRLCALADMPKPRVAIAETDMPNAFATGRNADHAVVCATRGIMRRLDNDELEGVLAHEMSHVAHKDVQVMTIASFLAIIAALLVRIAFYGELFGGGRRDNSNQNALPILLILMVVSAVVYAISFVLIRLLSRYRELSADRSGALLTGQPSKLASALVKVTGDIGRIPTRDLRTAQPLNAFFFAPAMSLHGAGAGQSKLANAFSTHPSLERRLAELDKIQQQLGGISGTGLEK